MRPERVSEPEADICLVLEGTYPYVSGGVSSWVHELLGSFPEHRFSLWHIGPHPDAYGEPRYRMPDNVVRLEEVFCHGRDQRRPPVRRPLLARPRPTRTSRVLTALHRLHTTGEVDDAIIDDLASADLSVEELLHGDETFEMFQDLYRRLTPEAPFTDVFWHLRAMHIPLVRLLTAPTPRATIYHSASTGYAGLLGAVASARTGAPLLVTEHGLYAREREMELARAPWIADAGAHEDLGDVELSPLRGLWSRFFKTLSRLAYQRATRLITLSEVNRQKQVADGADGERIQIVPNGVKLELYDKPRQDDRPAGVLRVGFVGRVVPIKDVLTLIRACALAVQSIDLEVWVIGPQEEDAAYARRCTDLVRTLRLESVIRFLGPQPVADMYPQLDVLLLTSMSEGQPLVILEAHAAGVPVVATDVGACRELLEGRPGVDDHLGPSGIVTGVANASDTADALVRLARDPELRRRMGRVGRERVTGYYQQRDVVAAYDRIYREVTSSPASAGS